MTAFQLAKINVRAKLRDYLTFLISNCVLVAIIYVFAAIYYNDDFTLLKSSAKYQPGIFTFVIVVLIFTAIFVWYSSSFFVRKRKQEIATYQLVGMSKKQVFQMLFAEQLFIGLISMAAGLVIGILFYKLVSMLFISMVQINTNIAFTISLQAIFVSIVLFSLLYIINGFFVSSLVHRAKLIDLYKATQITENKVKTNWFIGILGFLLLLGGYVMSVIISTPPVNVTDLMIVLMLVILGTYLFMKSFLNVLIKRLSKNKKRYYKAKNLTSLSQLSFRIKSNAVSLATVAILNAMVLTALGSMWSVYSTQQDQERYYQPFDMQYIASAEYDTVDSDVDAVIAPYGAENVTGEMRLALPRITSDQIPKAYVVSQTQFNEAAMLTGQAQPISLQDDEMMYTSQDLAWNGEYDHIVDLKQMESITFNANGDDFQLKPIDFRKDKITNGYVLGTVIVVSDRTFDNILAVSDGNVVYLRSFMLKDPLRMDDMLHEIDRVIPGELDGEPNIGDPAIDRDFETYVFRYRSAFSSLGIALFFAFFIGIMFLVVTGSVLYYKQMAESDNDLKRYRLLSDIGMSKKQISRSVGKQLGMIFAVPFILGTIDALFAMNLLNSILPQELMLRAIMVFLIYALMYSLYYAVTFKNYRRKVLSKNFDI